MLTFSSLNGFLKEFYATWLVQYLRVFFLGFIIGCHHVIYCRHSTVKKRFINVFPSTVMPEIKQYLCYISNNYKVISFNNY